MVKKGSLNGQTDSPDNLFKSSAEERESLRRNSTIPKYHLMTATIGYLKEGVTIIQK